MIPHLFPEDHVELNLLPQAEGKLTHFALFSGCARQGKVPGRARAKGALTSNR
jgi:hypothetical protein